MAIEDLFDHKCSIYHLQTIVTDMGFGVTSESTGYPDIPDLAAVPCHFSSAASTQMNQTESFNEYLYTGKLKLPAGTDVRVNDRIVDDENGLEYYAQVPRNIRGNHVAVVIYRKGSVDAAL